jgi:signal transduction histidine kinase
LSLSFLATMKALFNKFIQPRAGDEDGRRHEFILNILLVSTILLLTAAILSSAITLLFFTDEIRHANDALSFGLLFGILAFIFFLYFLSRKGFFRLASFLLLGMLFLLESYMAYRWGVEVQIALLLGALIVVMSGVLIGSRFAFAATATLTLVFGVINYLHRAELVTPNRYWASELAEVTDVVMFGVIFSIMATVSWLSNREIEKSLIRARKSEAELKDERDSLEMKVEQRTKELKEVQAEKMTQLYRFAELGRISSGLFHDLINPLNAISLNLGKVSVTDKGDSDLPIEETKQYVNNAVHAAKKLEDLVVAVRKQLAREETRTVFLIDEEIRHVIGVLSHKAQKAKVGLRFTPCNSSTEVHIFGDPIKFNQVVLNLVANGIDACIEFLPSGVSERWVRISVSEEPEVIAMLVEDNGVGIPEHHMDKIFEPFFTTKANGQGIGIGLSMAKRIVEKDFGGLLTAQSEVGKGASFRVHLPVRKQATQYAT